MELIKNILKNLEKNEKRKSYFVFFLVISILLLDFLGVTLFIPIISLIVNPEFYSEIKEIAFFEDWGKIKIINFFLASIVMVFIFKNLLFLFFNYYKKKLLAEISISFSSRIFNSYISEDYSFYLKKGNASMIRDITLIGSYTQNIELFLNLLIESIILVFVFIVALYINYTLALIIFLLSISSYFILFRVFSKRLENYGRLVNIYDQTTMDTYLNTFGSIKELILQKKQNFFRNKYTEIFTKNSFATVKSTFVIEAPRCFIEIGVVAVVSLVVFIFSKDLTNSGNFLAELAIFVTLIFRAMPSVSKMVYQSNGISLKLDLFNRVNKIIANASTTPKYQEKKSKNFKQFNFENIMFQNVSYEYEKNKKVIDSVDLKIKKNKTIGIIGGSGSGKSTLIDLISGLIKPTEGEIFINDKFNFNEDYILGLQEKVAYISQHNFLLNASIKENIAFGLEEDKINYKRLEEAISGARLKDFVNLLDDNHNYVVGDNGKNLSGGQRQRIVLARSLYRDASIFLFDEATSALDATTESQIFEDIKTNFHNKKTLIISTHNEKLLDFCNHIYEIKNKKITQIK